MSLTFNMVGGGGGGLKATDALLRVQAPAGSTVTISKGTTTKTDLGHENADDNSVYDYYFIIHASQFDSENPWNVTATLTGQDPVSATIVIDAADEYDIELSYGVPIFKNGAYGDGFSITAKKADGAGQGSYTATITDNNLVLHGQYNSGSDGLTCIYHTALTDLTDYSAIYIVVESYVVTSDTSRAYVGAFSDITSSAKSGAPSSALASTTIAKSGTETRYTVDVSNISTNAYIAVTFYVGGSNTSPKDITIKEWGLMH